MVWLDRSSGFFIKKLKSSLLIIIFEGTFLEKMLTPAGKKKFKSKIKNKIFHHNIDIRNQKLLNFLKYKKK